MLAARHDALAARLGGANWKRSRPRAVRSAHSARTRTWVGRAGGSLAPSANRELGNATITPWWSGCGHVHAPPAKHEALAPYTGARAAQQQRHERGLPAHTADRGADGAQAPRAQWRGWANTRVFRPSKHEPCSRHAVGTPAERRGTGACTLRMHRAKRSPPEVAGRGVSISASASPAHRGGVRQECALESHSAGTALPARCSWPRGHARRPPDSLSWRRPSAACEARTAPTAPRGGVGQTGALAIGHVGNALPRSRHTVT